MKHPLLQPKGGETHLLLGNEAIVRGALEAGINVVTCYPGTPSSEVPDTFRRLVASERFNLEYSVNEKVAAEVGLGAALSGAMTLTTMKHVGVNVAADPLFTSSYTGTPGGFVLLTADDPLCHSSQNEQDNRLYARFMGFPCFEPATADEARGMTKDALFLSRETQQPVMLRTTTRVNHLRGPVVFEDLAEPAEIVPFTKEPMRFVPIPAVARTRHKVQQNNLQDIAEMVEKSTWNRISGNAKIGVLASGISRLYVSDVLDEYGWHDKISFFELGFSWPLPKKALRAFLESCTTVLIVEEGEAVLEQEIRALVQEWGMDVSINGKGEKLTIFGEYSTSDIAATLAPLLGLEAPKSKESPAPMSLPMRPPSLCAGCAHRSVYYAVRKTYGDEAIYSNDIGCYTLGIVPPLRMADFLYCMGSSVSAGGGFAMKSSLPVVAFIGDSTFFHSGLSGLANAVFNKHNILLVILDNGTTAMTGHQPNPGVTQDLLGDYCQHLDIENIVRGLGVEHVAKVRPNNLKSTTKVLEEMKALSGVRVIIAEEPCVLFARRALKKEAKQVAYVNEQGPSVMQCIQELACPAFAVQDGEAGIDDSLCAGCMVCLQITSSIKARKRGE